MGILGQPKYSQKKRHLLSISFQNNVMLIVISNQLIFQYHPNIFPLKTSIDQYLH
jgi:hypothetical protein